MTPDWLDPIMKYIVVPMIAWTWKLHSTINSLRTEIEVLKAQSQNTDQSLREIKSILRDIQQALRK